MKKSAGGTNAQNAHQPKAEKGQQIGGDRGTRRDKSPKWGIPQRASTEKCEIFVERKPQGNTKNSTYWGEEKNPPGGQS